MDMLKTIAPYLRARFGDTQRGAALVEYALLLALIAVVCIAALTTLGGKASSKFNNIAKHCDLGPPGRSRLLTLPGSEAEERTSVRSSRSSRWRPAELRLKSPT